MGHRSYYFGIDSKSPLSLAKTPKKMGVGVGYINNRLSKVSEKD